MTLWSENMEGQSILRRQWARDYVCYTDTHWLIKGKEIQFFSVGAVSRRRLAMNSGVYMPGRQQELAPTNDLEAITMKNVSFS